MFDGLLKFMFYFSIYTFNFATNSILNPKSIGDDFPIIVDCRECEGLLEGFWSLSTYFHCSRHLNEDGFSRCCIKYRLCIDCWQIVFRARHFTDEFRNRIFSIEPIAVVHKKPIVHVEFSEGLLFAVDMVVVKFCKSFCCCCGFIDFFFEFLKRKKLWEIQ